MLRAPKHLLFAGILAPLCLASIGTAQRGVAPHDRPGARADKPDVLLLVIDDVGWPDLASVPTPNIDAIAEVGVSYDRFYSMPSCSPTRYQILFGRYGRRDGIGRIVTSYLPPAPDNPTPHHELLSLPKVAKSLGYRTAMIGKWHLGRDFLASTLEVMHAAVLDTRPAQQERNVNDVLVNVEAVMEPMLSAGHRLPVVRRQQDERLVGILAAGVAVEKSVDLAIHIANFAVVAIDVLQRVLDPFELRKGRDPVELDR